MISHSRRFIFIHIPKTGGESVASLFADDDPRISKHATAQQVENYLGEPTWQRYYSFCFVRNPWAQAVSMYFHLRKPLYMKEYAGQLLHPFNACRTAMDLDFSEYAREVFAKRQPQAEETRVDPWPICHYESQSHWIADARGRPMVDFVGRFETLDQDFAKVCGELQLENVTLPRRNQSQHGHYSDYYDSTTRETIAAHYSEDIQRFGYVFGA